MNQAQKNLLRWCAWFFIGNCAIFWLIGLNYIPTIPWIHSSYLTPKWKGELDFFVIVSYLGQLSFLAVLPSIFVFPCIFFARVRLVFIVAITLATMAAALLLVDTIVYNLYRFHLSGVIFQLAASSFNKSFFDFSQFELALIIFIAMGILFLESFFAWGLWRFVIGQKRMLGLGKWVAIALGASLYLSYTMIVFSVGEKIHHVLVETTRFLPLYTEVLGGFFPGENLTVAIAREGELHLEHSIRNDSRLNYPIHQLMFAPKHFTLKKADAQKTRQLNLVIILIDAWRFDMLNPEVTPSIYEFAKHSWYFSKHYSGGNSTGPGVFSLFYGIPASYWPAMETQKRGPLLIDELIGQHYKTGIFSSCSLKLPAFNKTVFSQLKELPQDITGDAYERDLTLTQQFKVFVDNAVKEKQPFFSYVHFGAAHGYCAFENDLTLFRPIIKTCNRTDLNNQTDPVPYFNRYKNALYRVDQQAQQMIETLKEHHLLKNTVVIITGDHGEEFNDNHQGYWSHASNFTTYQVRTPLIVYWPGEKPKVFNHMTSHYDIAPTLMRRLLGSTMPFSAYSIGGDLLDKNASHPYLLVGGYVDLGILEKDRITRVFSTGDFQVEKLNSQPEPGAKLHVGVLQQAFVEMRRFYR